MKIKNFFGLIMSCYMGINAMAAVPKASESDIVHEVIAPWMKKNDIPGIAVQVYTQGIPHSYYFGVQSRTTKVPVSGKTIFEVGSWTKLLTCLLLAEEVNPGKMKLSNPITRYLPSLNKQSPNPFQSMTLEQLGTYTAGLPFNVPDNIHTDAELSQYWAHWQPTSKNTWTYSNPSISFLGEAIAADTHQNISTLYRDKILMPLGMQSIAFVVPKQFAPDYAQGYDVDGKPADHVMLRFFPSAGALKMTANDALLFLQAALGMSGVPSITQAMKTTQTRYVTVKDYQQGLAWSIHPLIYPLSQKTRDTLLNPPQEMGMGPFPSTRIPLSQQKFDGSALMDKTGATYGFRSYIVVIPNKKSGVVILTNRYVSNGEIIKIGREILLKLDEEVIY
jgi:beta-lactamase class C